MKKVLIIALLAVGLTAFAQEKDGKRAGREKLTTDQKVELQVKKMNKDLGLNDKQTEQVKALVTKEVQKREAKKAEMQKTKDKKIEEMKTQMEAEQASVSAEMKKILTPEQFTKWEKIRDERKAKMRERLQDRKEKKD